MVNYFEATDRMDKYEKLSDYEKGFIDGIFSISNKIDKDYRPFIADSLAEYIDDYLESNKDYPPPECDNLEKCAEIFTYDFLMYYEEMAMDLLTLFRLPLCARPVFVRLRLIRWILCLSVKH